MRLEGHDRGEVRAGHMASVGVVIVNYRSLPELRRLLESGALRGLDVVLVDNASDPVEIVELAQKYDAQYLLNSCNVGFAGGVNAGILALQKERRVDSILLLNPDVSIAGAAIRRLHEELTSRDLDGVAPLLVEPGGRIQIGCAGGQVTLRSIAEYFLGVAHILPFLHGVFWTRRQCKRGGLAGWLCGGCLMLRAEAVERFGLLPEDELVYAEDIAWGTHATSKGARLSLISDVVVTHIGGASGGGAAWSGAMERLIVRRLPGIRGGLAVSSMRLGIGARRGLGRKVA